MQLPEMVRLAAESENTNHEASRYFNCFVIAGLFIGFYRRVPVLFIFERIIISGISNLSI